jgi:predicted DNA-binding protein with PD1-like motif
MLGRPTDIPVPKGATVKFFPSNDGAAALVRLPRGSDLLQGLTQAAQKLGIDAGSVQAIGAVDELTVAFFEPEEKEYRPLRFGDHFEITSSLGNVSLKDGQPFVHVHVTASDREGRVIGGHLLEGSRVFLIEASFRALGGEPPVRQQEDGLGLAVWQ